ncbi:hypothetical protein [Thiohalophilus sp.]|uniref:hypothetical protein n=1 Tax=Thiohalophilus sp. TaxID=3028392 RepID=UPI002ACD3550|nr:hypothetical protein [Thiohalophilus sp.]MDZ7662272.1 hypothetical protein [Thiohalophilus sp.]
MMRLLKTISCVISLVIISSIYLPATAADQEDVQQFFSKNKVGNSPDYAFVKDGVAGKDHSITIHGYADDKAVCEALVKVYNAAPSLSTLPGKYQCIPLNK